MLWVTTELDKKLIVSCLNTNFIIQAHNSNTHAHNSNRHALHRLHHTTSNLKQPYYLVAGANDPVNFIWWIERVDKAWFHLVWVILVTAHSKCTMYSHCRLDSC